MTKRVLIAVSIVAALALLGWFSISQSSNNSAAPSTTAMSSMTMGETNNSATETDAAMPMPGTSMGHSGAMTGMKPLVAGANGTRASAGGLTLEPKHAMFTAGQTMQWQLHVVDHMGMPITKFQRDQTKLMHLIVVRTDLTGYQHVHPVLGRDGIFTIDLRLPRPGSYRAIADFTTSGRRYALGVSIHVPGAGIQAALPPEAMNASVDGFSVEAIHGMPMAGKESELQFVVRQNGKPVVQLLPYLGAYGHLVALRKPDLAYSHVHPTSDDRSKGFVRFVADFPTGGAYRLFLQFRTSSGVHTAPFTINVQS
jgi:hypothetical protein